MHKSAIQQLQQHTSIIDNIWEKGTNVLRNLGKIGELLITARWMG